MIEDCVADHHQKSLDSNLSSPANVLEKSCDGEGSEKSSNIHIEVKFLSRKESSVDTNYEDYLNQFTAEGYLSEMESMDEIRVNRAKIEDCCSNSISLSQHPSSDRQLIPHTGCELNYTIYDVEQSQKSSPVTKFWYGYGRNIYFQPMTCKTVPRAMVKSMEKCQMIRPSRRANFNIKNQISPMDFRLDVSTSKSALDNIGTLRFVESGRLGKRLFKDILSVKRVNGARVGNFIMSEELKVRLCKGFVCRTTDKLGSPTKAITFPYLLPSNDTACVKTAIMPTCLANQGPCSDKVKRALNRSEKKSKFEKKNRTPESLESQDFFSLFPKMMSPPHYIGKLPRKKEISGKSLHLTTNSQTISKINLFPFVHPLVYKDKAVRKAHSAAKLMHCSPDVNEDKSIKHLEEKVVADHLQEMEKYGHFKSTNFRDISSEEKYAYESLFSYYNEKVNDAIAKTGSLKTALTTKSLTSPHQKSREKQTEDSSKSQCFEDSLKPVGDEHFPDDKKLESASKQGKPAVMQIAGKELNFTGKPILNDVQGNQKISPEGRYTGIGSKRIFTLVDKNIIITDNQDNCISTDNKVELFSSSVHQKQHDAKAVHFEECDGIVGSTELTSYEPLIAKTTLPVDRYEVPAPVPCRLPVIGKKMPSKPA